MKLRMVGCSHHSASVAVRERLAFSATQAGQALSEFRQQFPQTEAVLLSTCNRVEIYTASDDVDRSPSHEQVAAFLARFHGVPLYEVFDELFEHTGEDAVRHLFTVAASLDSMVVGEAQILAQVKQAYLLATDRETTGPLTHAIFQAALRVARRVSGETLIQQRRVSVPSVAVGDFARQIFERFDDKRTLVIGAGDMAEETLRYLVDEGVRQITIVNRHAAKAADLAERFQGETAPWEELDAALAQADLVISTTGASEPIMTQGRFAPIIGVRHQRPLFVLDLAVPRDFEPAIGECLGVYLYSIDDLREVCQANRRQRDRELPAALRIIEQETTAFMQELFHRETAPIIMRLKQGWHRPKEEELRRLFNKLPQLDARARGEISQSFDRLVNKLLHPPLESLRDEARTGTPHLLLEALKRLFQLRD